jgi:hypothetical protein
MLSSARLGLLTGALAIASAASAAGALPARAHAGGGPSVSVHGRLLVVPAETPGGHPAYAVALADGDIVPLRGVFDADLRTGAVFDGRLELPSSVLTTLSRRGESDATAALRIVDRRKVSLDVIGTPSVTEAPPVDDVATTHEQFVAALDNKGALNQSDAQLLGHVSDVGGYWQGESNGAIAAVTVPATVKHYDTATGSTACGLGSGQTDFFNLVQEAIGKFPGIDPFGGTDQLVIFVPASCSSGSTVGRGTIGASFASGGALIAESSTSIEGVYAHEAGHNYGFQHANARWSGTSMEYFGIYDVMGFALPPQFNMLTALSTPYRVFQGVTDIGEIQDVDLGNGLSAVHVTAVVKPRSDDTGLRSLRVHDPDTGEILYLDYRSGTGQDAGSAYAATGSLTSPSGSVFYAPGLTVNAARTVSGAPSGVDTLVVDPSGDTSLGATDSWSNASGLLTVTVTAMSATAANVSVDYTPPQDFTTVGTPVIGGTVKVGGTVTVDTGTWVPAPTTTQIRWTANGQAVSSLNDKTSFTAGPELAGQQLVATVTGKKPGYHTTSAQSGGVTVSPGAIPTTGDPGISGTAQVGFTLHAGTGTWTAVLSPVTSSYQWQRGGVDITGATSADYQVVLDDVGSAITVVQTLDATGYESAELTSSATDPVPEPVIDPAPTPTLTGTPRVGTALHATTGTWMDGTDLGYQWFVAGVPVGGATGTSYTPTAGDLGQTVRVEVTGTRADYPTVTHASVESGIVAPGVLSASKPTITGKAKVGKTLTAKPGTWSAGTTFSYAWYASGTKIKHESGRKLTLTNAQKGMRITVKVTGKKPGYTSLSMTSGKTAKVT